MGEFSQLDWEDLRHFLALAEDGSLSAAARRLGVDHSTVARRLASLEAALALRLVDRLPRAVVLTAEGRRIAELGREMAEGAFGILRAAQGAAPALAGPVCISAPPAYASVVLAPRLAHLRAGHPEINVTLLGELAAANLTHRQADIALRMSRPDSPELVVQRLCALPFGLYAARGYDLPEAEWSFICHGGGSLVPPQQSWLEARLAGRPVTLCTNDFASQASAARAGMGVALLPYFLGEDPALQPMPVACPLPVRDIWMVVHSDLRRAPRIRAVMDFLVEQLGTAE